MCYAVTSSLKLVERLDYAVLGVCQRVENETDACCVIRNWAVKLELILTLGLVCEVALCQTDTLYKTFSQESLRLLHYIEYLVLNR